VRKERLRTAAIEAGYPAKNAAQLAISTFANPRKSSRSLTRPDSTRHYNRKVFKTSTRRTETIYVQSKGKITQVGSDYWGPRLTALKEAFRCMAARACAIRKEAAQYGVKIIIADIPGFR
jgi:hypothetical protein